MTRIKICGITNFEDALMVTMLGADSIGFVFAPSKRKVNPELARSIIKHIPSFITMVGVFMDNDFDEVDKIADFVPFDVIQLHGNEPPDYCSRLKKRVIKRILVSDSDTRETLIEKIKMYSNVTYLLDPGTGSGRVFDWTRARDVDVPVIIAGGLTPDNVKGVVKLLNPYGVDVASGVESAPGKKHREKVEKFIKEVRACSLPA
jgi:phosphoribosylanthranilate isomerase